jgi:hypothetical protein
MIVLWVILSGKVLLLLRRDHLAKSCRECRVRRFSNQYWGVKNVHIDEPWRAHVVGLLHTVVSHIVVCYRVVYLCSACWGGGM